MEPEYSDFEGQPHNEGTINMEYNDDVATDHHETGEVTAEPLGKMSLLNEGKFEPNIITEPSELIMKEDQSDSEDGEENEQKVAAVDIGEGNQQTADGYTSNSPETDGNMQTENNKPKTENLGEEVMSQEEEQIESAEEYTSISSGNGEDIEGDPTVDNDQIDNLENVDLGEIPQEADDDAKFEDAQDTNAEFLDSSEEPNEAVQEPKVATGEQENNIPESTEGKEEIDERFEVDGTQAHDNEDGNIADGAAGSEQDQSVGQEPIVIHPQVETSEETTVLHSAEELTATANCQAISEGEQVELVIKYQQSEVSNGAIPNETTVVDYGVITNETEALESTSELSNEIVAQAVADTVDYITEAVVNSEMASKVVAYNEPVAEVAVDSESVAEVVVDSEPVAEAISNNGAEVEVPADNGAVADKIANNEIVADYGKVAEVAIKNSTTAKEVEASLSVGKDDTNNKDSLAAEEPTFQQECGMGRVKVHFAEPIKENLDAMDAENIQQKETTPNLSDTNSQSLLENTSSSEVEEDWKIIDSKMDKVSQRFSNGEISARELTKIMNKIISKKTRKGTIGERWQKKILDKTGSTESRYEDATSGQHLEKGGSVSAMVDLLDKTKSTKSQPDFGREKIPIESVADDQSNKLSSGRNPNEIILVEKTTKEGAGEMGEQIDLSVKKRNPENDTEAVSATMKGKVSAMKSLFEQNP